MPWDDLNARVIAKAWKDEAFRQELLKDPKGALEREFKLEFPENVTIDVLQETSNKVYMVLPEKKDDELNPDELDDVAGGIGLPQRPGTGTKSGSACCGTITCGCKVTPTGTSTDPLPDTCDSR